MITNMGAIDTNRIEGRYLIAAILKMKLMIPLGEDSILKQLEAEQAKMYERAGPCPVQEGPPEKLIDELAAVINRRSLENESDTPDFILAAFLSDCLTAYGRASSANHRWHGWTNNPGPSPVPEKPRFVADFTLGVYSDDRTFEEYKTATIQGIIRSMVPPNMEGLFVTTEVPSDHPNLRKFEIKTTF